MKKIWLGAILLCAAIPAHAQSVLKKTLPNGLTILARENHNAPVVAVRLYVKTGSIYEGQHLGSGLSHLFEHTLFEGTKTRDKKALNDELQAIGGQSNAYTSYDVTAYHVTTAKNYFGRAVNLLGDMAQNATFPEAEVKVQQGVIHNEMNLGEDDPDRALSELWSETAFRVHPVRLPIIGYKEQFDALSRQEILDYYRSHYTPENSIVSVAGDVSAPEVFEAVEKEFGAWPRRAALAPTLPTEPRQNSPRRAVLEKDVNQTLTQIGWRTVPLQSPDLYALDVLAQILGGSESSRLPLEIVQQKNLAQSVSAYSSTPNYDAGAFLIRAATPPQNAARVENLIRAQIRSLKQNGVTESELGRAKTQIRAAFILGGQDVENQAEQAAYDELATGDPNYSRSYVANIQKVSAAQILDVARRYLRDEGTTVAVVKPRAKAAPTQATAPAQTANVAPEIQTLSNGMRVVLRPTKGSGTVAFTLMGAGGVRSEPSDKAGIANLTALLLTRGTAGTKTRSAEEIARLVDEVGGSLAPFSGYNAWGIEGQFLTSDWKRGINLLAEAALSPAFAQDEIQKVRAQMLDAIASQDDDPLGAAGNLLRRLYYGRHPYGRTTLGTEAALKKISRADIVNFWNASFQPRQTVLAVYGDFDKAAMERTLRLLFGTAKAKGAPLGTSGEVAPPPSFTSKVLPKPGIAQTALFYGFPSIKIQSDDRFAIDVLDAALSGANLPGGRLHERLRDNQLVYVVHAYNSPGVDGGMFVIYAATTPQNRARAKAIIEEEIAKIKAEPISAQELERAKSMTISAHAIGLQTASSGAREVASNLLFGLSVGESARYAEAINAVTAQDVQNAARKYLDKESAALAIVEPGEAKKDAAPKNDAATAQTEISQPPVSQPKPGDAATREDFPAPAPPILTPQTPESP